MINRAKLEIKFAIRRTIISPLFPSILLPSCSQASNCACLMLTLRKLFFKKPGHKHYGNDIHIRDMCKYSDLVGFRAILLCGRLAEAVEFIK